MFGIGTTELLVILVVALIVVGPKKLPQIAKTLGKAMGEFKRVSTDLHRTINVEIDREEQKSRDSQEEKKKTTAKQKASKKSDEDK
ncbi:MAG: Sec-independent protein translocase protein TatB, partial [Oceanidesulfovibrio sp.]